MENRLLFNPLVISVINYVMGILTLSAPWCEKLKIYKIIKMTIYWAVHGSSATRGVLYVCCPLRHNIKIITHSKEGGKNVLPIGDRPHPLATPLFMEYSNRTMRYMRGLASVKSRHALTHATAYVASSVMTDSVCLF